MNEAGPALLVVDDNENNRYTLIRRLGRNELTEVDQAENGRQALEMMAARAYDLVLLDIMMPEMDGYQVLEHMKADMHLRNIPVIMISAVDEIDSVVRCIEMGAEDYLAKPFNAVLLQARIGACLEKKRLRDQEASYLEHIRAEKQRSDDLLNVILPAAAVAELKATGSVTPRRYDNVAVLFADIVGFTAYCDQHSPENVVAHLQTLVEDFERIALDHEMEKIKTIGDAFMATGGLLKPVESPLMTGIRCGFEMAKAAKRLDSDWEVRVGIHAGPVVAGIVGHRQYLFDVWGDTVNVAARMVDLGAAGTITMAHSAWLEVQDQCEGRSLGQIELKGKGSIEIVECRGLR